MSLAAWGDRTGTVAAGGRSGCGHLRASSDCSVLFIGNSYTYENDLPGMFARLASAGGHRVKVGSLAEPSATLEDHVSEEATSTTLSSTEWNVVVLQEQSEIPALARLRQTEMYPAARQLVAAARHVHAEPLFYLTAAHRSGWPAARLSNYTSMQMSVDFGYLAIAHQLNAAVAPVGIAWQKAIASGESGLWQSDGSHPTDKGSYLAACVFYASLFKESPDGLAYTAALPRSIAIRLQQLATEAVYAIQRM